MEQPGFEGCTTEQLQPWEDKFTMRCLPMGETLLVAETLPESVSLLIKGQLRQLVSHPEQPNRSMTLVLHEPPYLAGWASLQAGQSVEFITAASECELLSIATADWKQLLRENPAIGMSIQLRVSPADLWPLLQTQDDLPLPTAGKELRPWLKRLSAEAEVCIINPGAPSHQALDPRTRWLVAAKGETIPYGSKLDAEQMPAVQSQLLKPLRLIGLPEVLWLHPHHSLGVATRRADKSQTERNALPASEEIREQAEEEGFDPSGYRFYSSAPGAVPETLACFRIVADALKLPFKTDVFQRVLEEQAARGDGGVSLQLCAALAESLGLQTQLLNLPVGLASRLETPSLIHLADGEMSVALATRQDALLLARPRSDIETLSFDELNALTGEDGLLQVLLLRTTDRTPQKKFGLAWFIPALKKNKRALIEVLVASLFVQLFQLMNPLIVQQIVDKVIGQNGMSTLPVLAVLLVSFSIFENILTAVRTNLFIETTNRIDLSLGEQIIDHLLRLPLGYFDRRPVGELSSRLGELEQIRSFLTGTALTVVLDVIFSSIYIIVMLIYSWVLTIVALIVAPLLALITVSTSPVIRRQLRSKAELNAKTQNHLVEVLSGIQTVKAQNFELKARWRWKERYANYVSESFRNAVTSTATNGVTQFLNQVSTLAILCVGAYLVIEGQLTLGQLIAFRIIAGYVTGPLLRLSNVYQNFQQTALSMERLADIIDTPQESNDADRVNIPMPRINGAIHYENVSFRFGQEGPLQLSQVEFEIPAGEFVAIVGQSGSGKSTLTKLIPRLYPPLSGRIQIDQYDIAKVELYSLRRQIGIVPQDSLLFEGSVQENIGLTNPEATSEEIITAARVACAHDFIMSLPAGYSSPVGERGSGLSGGQRQRIAIARTVLQNPRMLIMDEATSALDYETERRVSLNLMEHFRGRTVLFITHRLSSIQHADRILLMHQGRLEEQGTHQQLMAQRGRYYALYQQQESANN